VFAFAAIVGHPQAAAFDYVPLLFIAYVIYAIVSSLAKAAKQAQKAQQTQQQSMSAASVPQSVAPAAPTMTADAVRAALARRAAAIVSRIAPSVGPSPARGLPDSAPASLGTASPLSTPSLTLIGDTPDAPPDLRSLLANLPPAAQAIVASAVIGPCAAHRGGGHIPEDW
jgi:hypothetical protein